MILALTEAEKSAMFGYVIIAICIAGVFCIGIGLYHLIKGDDEPGNMP